jgi:predicted lipoprotein with Yx(FWY)xxD motif
MVNYKTLSAIFVVIALVFAAATGYLAAYPPSSSTHVSTQTTTQFSTITSTATASPVSSSAQYTVNLVYKAGIGFYLTNASGYTLYFRATDPGNGSSTCTGSCVSIWPLFYAGSGAINVPPGLSASSFGVATRSDGLKQTTYNGYPLYYYESDKAPGQTTGEGKGSFYACCSILAPTTTTATTTSSSSSTAYTVNTASSSSIGNYLVNGTGFTLYYFSADTPGSGTSACTGACTGVWPAFYTANLTLPSGLSSSNFGTITTSNGSKQLTYDGWPLYYYAADSASGQTNGQGINSYGGLWHAMPVSGPSSATTTSSSSIYGY